MWNITDPLNNVAIEIHSYPLHLLCAKTIYKNIYLIIDMYFDVSAGGYVAECDSETVGVERYVLNLIWSNLYFNFSLFL